MTPHAGERRRDAEVEEGATLVGVRLEPSCLEAEFWSSETTKSTILSVNKWGVATSVAVSFLACYLARRRPRGTCPMNKTLFLASMMLLVVQAWTTYCRPRTYLRYHRAINAATRLLRVVQSLLAYMDTAYYMLLLIAVQNPSSRTFMFIVSQWPWFSFLNAINFPLPWCWQLPIVAIKSCVDIFVGLPVVNCALHHPQSQHSETAAMVCRSILGTLTSAGQLIIPIHAEYEEVMFGASTSGLAVALFLQLFVGAAIPLQIIYWYEQRVKIRFLAARGHHYVNAGSDPLQKVGWCAAWALLCCIAAKHMISLDWFNPEYCSSMVSTVLDP